MIAVTLKEAVAMFQAALEKHGDCRLIQWRMVQGKMQKACVQLEIADDLSDKDIGIGLDLRRRD